MAIETENKYYQRLRQNGSELTAQNLLELVQRDAEDILTVWGRMGTPDTVHLRTIRTLIDIRDQASHTSLRRQRQFFQQEDDLRFFLCVYRTVRTLQGKPSL